MSHTPDTKPSPAATSTQIVAELARQLQVAKQEPKTPAILDGAPYVILRDADGAERVHSLQDCKVPPHRKTGTVKLKDDASFILYYNLHGNAAPVYATLEPARFVAVLNDHTKDAAGHRDHRVEFIVAHSREWSTWAKHNGSGAAFNSTESLALFLEENSLDIVKPDAATMLNIALNFRLKSGVQFSAAQRLQDGNIDFVYQNVVNASSATEKGGSAKIPELFTIEVPIFDGINAKKYRLDARFRFRLRDGAITLWYELVRPHKAIEQAFKEMWDGIQKATKAPILHGSPE